LNNLIDSPEHQEEIERMRAALIERMEATRDPALGAFLGRDDPARLDPFMVRRIRAAGAERLSQEPMGRASNAARLN
jgi:hypothetical protein